MKFAAWWAALLAVPAVLAGPQSDNFGIPVVPAPEKVTIDGRLDEWDESGRILVFADWDLRDRYSASVAAMWDADNLYLAVRRKDPTPLQNRIDPAFNPNDGWKGDALQLRLRTDQVVWVTSWFFTPQQQPVVHLEYGKTPQEAGGGRVIVCAEKPDRLGNGVELVYRADADGKGYVEEMKIPWKLLYRDPAQIRAGGKFRLGVEVVWGDPNNPGWPLHRYADNLQPGNTSREFFWKNVNGWGDAELLARGGVPLRSYAGQLELQPGTVPVRVTLPAGSRFFTLVIEDESGRRVRNLAGAFPVDDYRVGGSAESPEVEVKWDGLDDWGKLVSPGSYRVRGLASPGLSAELDMCYYNPGHPPWGNLAGTGAWGADHHAPRWVRRAGDWMVLGWDFAEGGSGIIGVDDEGNKRWGENRGAAVLGADAKYAYAVINSWYGGGRLCRFDARTGKPAPFVLNGQERQFELPVSELAGEFMPKPVAEKKAATMSMAESSPASALASDGEVLVMSLVRGDLLVLDAQSAERRQVLPVREVAALSFAPDGTLYGIVGGKPARISLTDGRVEMLPLSGIGLAVDITVNEDGEIAILDGGPDSQLKIYDQQGKLLRTAGRRGGRPLSGEFDSEALMQGSSAAFDARGRIWVTECWDYPRRVSVWEKSPWWSWSSRGRLYRDYVGNTGYAGTGGFLDETEPDYAYIGPVEMRLDRDDRSYEVTRILWVPDESKNQAFPLLCTTPHWFANASFTTSSASGQERKYLFFYDKTRTVYLPFGDHYQPVAAIGHLGDLPESIRTRLFADADPKDGFFWNDRNFDGAIQRDEVELVNGGHGFTRSMTDWGNRLGDQLDIYVNGIFRFDPVGFAENGAPLYGPAGKHKLAAEDQGDLVPVPDSDTLLALSFDGFPQRTRGLLGYDRKDGRQLWSYPSLYPSVHGSHRAPMARPGLLIGPLKITGTARIDGGLGDVFMVRGNLGEDYYFTTDGLYIGKMFQDCRLPGGGLPDDDRGKIALDDLSGGGEPFCGWFGKLADGRVLATVAFVRQAGTIIEVKGLEQVKRLPAFTLELSPEELAACIADNQARSAAAAAARAIRVGKMIGNNFAALPVNEVKQPGNPVSAKVRLGYDERNLYVQYEVADPSPMRNSGNDYRKLFKTGDAVDLMLEAAPGRPLRLLFSKFEGKPVAVLTEVKKPDARPEVRHVYHSPVMNYPVDRVEVLTSARVKIDSATDRYTVTATVPLAELGLRIQPGMKLRGDLGIIASDAEGTVNTARIYRFNRDTNLVNDLPGEAQLDPKKWGEIEFAR